MNVFHKVTLKSLAINKTRTIVTIIGIILSVSMITAITTLISSLQNYMLKNAIYTEGDWHGAFFDLDRETAERIKKDDKVHSAACAENIGYAEIGSSNEYKPYLFVMGADDLFLERMPVHLVSGRLPGSPDEIILPSHLATNGNVVFKAGDVLELEIGDRYFAGHKLLQNNPFIHPKDIMGSEENIPYGNVDDENVGDENAGDEEVDDKNGDDNDDEHVGEENVGNENDGDKNAGDKDADEGDSAAGGRIRKDAGERLVIREVRKYTVVGFYERPNFEQYTAPGYTAITKMGPEGKTGSFAVYLKMNNPNETYDFMNSFEHTQVTNHDVLMLLGISRYNNFYKVLYGLAAILIGLIMFGSISLIYNAFAISVSERTRQFGMMSSIGATKRQIRRMVLFEALAVSSVGIPLGILSGILGIGVTLELIGDKFSSFFGGQGLPLRLQVTPASIAIACVMALVTVLISAWIPSKRATRISPVDAIRLSRDIAVNPREVKTSPITYKFFGLEGMIARKHFKRSKKKYRATVVSLFLSTVLFISASSFCTYLTDSVTSTLQDTDYDIILYYRSDDSENMDPDNLKNIHNGLASSVSSLTSSSYAVKWSVLCNIPVDLLTDYYIRYFNIPEEETEVGIHTMIYGIGDDVYLQYLNQNRLDEKIYMDRNNPKGLGQAVISRFDPSLQKFVTVPILKGTSVILNYEGYDYKKLGKLPEEEQQAVLEGKNDREYRVSMTLELDIVKNDLVTGLNESISSGIKIMYPMSLFPEFFDVSICEYYFQAKNPSKAYEEIMAYLTDKGITNSNYTLINKYEMNETERNLVTIIKVFSYGFIVLISLIALANVFNTINTNILLRRREFAMLKSVGMTKKGFRKMMNYECILYGFKSLVWGIPAAFGVTWLIYRSIKSGYDTAFYLPWTSVAIAVCSVFAVVFATMIYSMRKINKENPIDALKNDN